MTTTTRRVTMLAAPRRPETATDTWENRSACINRPAHWWDGDQPELTAKARATCLSCPVLAECLGEQMRLETAQMWSRSGIRGGLTAAARIQLCIDERNEGAYDAEEARLLALEAGAYGKPVAEIADAGVSQSTIRLAARMAGETLPLRDVEKAKPGTALEAAFLNATQIMQWREAGVGRNEICARIGLNRSAVDEVVRTYRRLTGEVSEQTAMDEVSDSEKTLIGDYLGGRQVTLSREQQITAIAHGLALGMTYLDIDKARGYSRQTTAQFVSRQRKRYEQAGKPFPITKQEARRVTLTDEQVIAIREASAAGGVTDMELALQYEVSRNVISHVVSGRNYKHVGGPIRQGKSVAAKRASKEWNDKVCRLAFAPNQAKKKMGEAA